MVSAKARQKGIRDRFNRKNLWINSWTYSYFSGKIWAFYNALANLISQFAALCLMPNLQLHSNSGCVQSQICRRKIKRMFLTPNSTSRRENKKAVSYKPLQIIIITIVLRAIPTNSLAYRWKPWHHFKKKINEKIKEKWTTESGLYAAYL